MRGEYRTEVIVVDGDDEGRLDAFLAARLDLSRTQIQRLIEQGRVIVDGRGARKSDRVEAGQEIEITIPPPVVVAIEPENIPLDVVYEDDALLVVNKAAGMVVHPSAGHPHGTLVNALLAHVDDLSGIGGELRPGIVHRLDKDTSGLLVVAKRDGAHQALSEGLRLREIKRLYLAAAWGHIRKSPITVDAPVGRDPRNRLRMAVVEGGREAVTRVRLKEDWKAAQLLELALKTGRTHQIRVHLEHVGHPVVGDQLYGVGWERGMGGSNRGWAKDLQRRVSRQFLHAWSLSFAHPDSGDQMCFEAPLPPDLEKVAEWARRN
ncbi:MAG: RluA family pseudouridine synthase [Gemmatimonadota bacterium]|nr:MAG: RluA family pseudouridine synthase [Gemmatimonadota bacterium]